MNLSHASLDWALKHIESFGDTDMFPLSFEYEAIRAQWDGKIRDQLARMDLLQYKTGTFRRCLSPKHRFGFRISTQLDPFDALFYTSLIYELGEDIESSRVPTDQEIVHSFRFQPDDTGRLFDRQYNYNSFINICNDYSSSEGYEWVVIADIADFFPRIYLHPLENKLQSCTKKSDHVKSVINLTRISQVNPCKKVRF